MFILSRPGPAPRPRGAPATPPGGASGRDEPVCSQSRLGALPALEKDGGAGVGEGQLIPRPSPGGRTARGSGGGTAGRTMDEGGGGGGGAGSDGSHGHSGGEQQRELERMAEVLVTGEQLR